jgi:beta-aspartyl-peptidase (threonine type)
VNTLRFSVISALFLGAAAITRAEEPVAGQKVVLVIHGGAGVRPRAEMSHEMRLRYEEDLRKALRAGHAALQKGTSLDAIEAAIKVMEDSPLFNAGVGAVFTHDGRIELDASIMEGKEKKAGAVASVTRIKNPISAARAVMEKSEHVLMVGEGAERFALGAGVPEANPVEFWTEDRWKELLEELEKEKRDRHQAGAQLSSPARHQFGTVGAVALDRHGNLAAGTSTGGLLNKRHGRVGDSPIIGAGTYAENGACAVSGTGHGEIFIRYAVAHEIVSTVKHAKGGVTVGDAAKGVISGLPLEEGGVGGVIALDAQGNAAMEFDTEGMYRGTVTEQGVIEVKIYKGE